MRKIAIPVLLLLITACGAKEEEKKPEAKKAGSGGGGVFDATIVQSFPINRDIETAGTILPNEMAELHPEVAGRVTAITFREGANVQKGTLLVKLFDADIQAQVNKLQVQLKIAGSAEKRQSELLAISGTSQQEYEATTLQVSNIRADIEVLKVDISRTEIRAPFSGRIGLRLISPGAYVTPATIITNIASVSQVKIQFPVPAQYVEDIQNGKAISFTMTGSDKKYFATVIATENEITGDTRNLLVRAVVKNPDIMVKPGAYAEVAVAIGSNRPAMMVPSQAVIPLTRGKRVIVIRNGTSVFQNVETGYRDSASVEIVKGLMNGDTILTSGLLVVKPQQRVKVTVKK